MAESLISGIKTTPAVFSILKEDASVFEFQFSHEISVPARGEVSVMVTITSPLARGDLMLTGCAIHLQETFDGARQEPPASWLGDARGLKALLEDIIEANRIPEIKEMGPQRQEDPAMEAARARLDELAKEVALVMTGVFEHLEPLDHLRLWNGFATKTLEEMAILNHQKQCPTPQT